MTEAQILDALRECPRYIYGGPPRDIYFDLQERGLITMRQVEIDSQETAIEVRLAASSQPRRHP